MLNFTKKFLIPVLAIFVIIGGYNVILKIYYSNPKYLDSIITLQPGDECQNYRFIDYLDSHAFLTSIIQSNDDKNIYEISFRQYCNHDYYDFMFKVFKGDFINAYFCKKPFKFENKKCELVIYEINDKSISIKLNYGTNIGNSQNTVLNFQ